MVLKSAFAVAFCTGLLALAAPVSADEYRADEFLGLDLPSAVLSPKRLGPGAQFAPIPIEAKTDRGEGAQVRAEPAAQPESAATPAIKSAVKSAVAKARVAHVRDEPPRAAARTKLARRHGNPLDAQASDTRIQAWPCKSGGICNWQR